MTLDDYNKTIKEKESYIVELIDFDDHTIIDDHNYLFVLCNDHVKAFCYYDKKYDKIIPVDSIKHISYKYNTQHTALTKQIYNACVKYITSLDCISDDDRNFVEFLYIITNKCLGVKWMADTIEKEYLSDKPQEIIDMIKPIFEISKTIKS